MSWNDFETPSVEEIKDHFNSKKLIKSHVLKYECPECGHENFVTYSDGFNNDYTCSGRDCENEFRYVG